MKLIIRKGDTVFEASEVSVVELKELVGLNGQTPLASQNLESQVSRDDGSFVAFFRSLSNRGQLFCDTLKNSPNGIAGDDLALALGFQGADQLGDLIGAGMSSVASQHNIKLKDDIYTTELRFVGGQRQNYYWPGKLLLEN